MKKNKAFILLVFLFFFLSKIHANTNYNHQSQYGITPFVISLGGISSPLFDDFRAVADNPATSSVILRESAAINSAFVMGKAGYSKVPLQFSMPIPWGVFSIVENFVILPELPEEYSGWLSSTKLIFAKDLTDDIYLGLSFNVDLLHQNNSKEKIEKTTLGGLNLDIALNGKIAMKPEQKNFDLFDFQYGISLKNIGWIPTFSLENKDTKIYYKSMLLKAGLSSLFMKIPIAEQNLQTRFLFELNTSLPNDEFSPDAYFSSALNFNLLLANSIPLEKIHVNFATQIKPLRSNKQVTFFSGFGINFYLAKLLFQIDYGISLDENVGNYLGLNVVFGQKDDTPPQVEIDF